MGEGVFLGVTVEGQFTCVWRCRTHGVCICAGRSGVFEGLATLTVKMRPLSLLLLLLLLTTNIYYPCSLLLQTKKTFCDTFAPVSTARTLTRPYFCSKCQTNARRILSVVIGLPSIDFKETPKTFCWRLFRATRGPEGVVVTMRGLSQPGVPNPQHLQRPRAPVSSSL